MPEAYFNGRNYAVELKIIDEITKK